ncbi:MAG TPA: CAP domain-containing protein [Acidimicrobiales bacterium]|nr:CAP domain-containing protein [Acidimicrobiales bacterium]
MRTLLCRLVGLVLMAALLVSVVPAQSAGADNLTDEQAFAAALNEVRAGAGLPPLAMEVRLVDIARGWSAQMAAANVLSHNPSMSSQAPSNWQRLGENVGFGGSVDSIHKALVASPGHYANIVNPYFNYVGVGVVRSGDRIWVTQNFMQAPSGVLVQTASASGSAAATGATADGYRILASTGGVYDFGTAGSFGGVPAGSRIVGGASTPSHNGYWAVAEDGTVHARGDAGSFGGLGGTHLSAPIVGMAASPTGKGYWLLGRDGGVFTFGDAGFFGSTGDLRLNKPVVGITASPTGKGYWFVASDGGIFAFGDADFFGSTGDIRLNQPIVGMAASPSGHGYWLVARDGGIFAFGDSDFFGSTGDIRLNQPIVGLAPSASGKGYRFVAADGGIFNFGDAGFAGSAGGMGLGQTVVAMVAG